MRQARLDRVERRLDRRLTPRPLPGHLASAILLWLSSRAALTSSKLVSPLSNAPGDPLQAIAPDVERLGPDQILAALDRELLRRASGFAAGLEVYRRHPFRRAEPLVPVVWREGAMRLLDYGQGGAGPPVLVIPSLINRYYVLDLLPEQSFLRHLAEAGLRPFMVDWGEPGPAEREFTLTDYISGPLDWAAAKVSALANGPVAILGYCMGGLWHWHWRCAARGYRLSRPARDAMGFSCRARGAIPAAGRAGGCCRGSSPPGAAAVSVIRACFWRSTRFSPNANSSVSGRSTRTEQRPTPRGTRGLDQ